MYEFGKHKVWAVLVSFMLLASACSSSLAVQDATISTAVAQTVQAGQSLTELAVLPTSTPQVRDPDLIALGVPERLGDRKGVSLGAIDLCRLAEIYWAAKRIEEHLENAGLEGIEVEGDLGGSGQGMGVLEAPRGVLGHDDLVDRGRVERLRLTVATQFNNAYINLLLLDLAEKHVEGDRISSEGERLIGRCIRNFDPCISCATH